VIPSPRSLVRHLASSARAVRGGGRGRALLAIAAGWFLVLGLRFVVPALLPFIKGDFGISNATAGAAITLLWVIYGGMQFPAGALIDRVGERRLLAASALVGATGLASYALSPTFGVFLAATVVFGLGSGLYGPARGTVLSRTFPDNDGIAFGIVLASGSIGSALLPAAAAALAVGVGWRLVLGVTIPLFLLVGFALWSTVPDASPRQSSEPTRTQTDGGVSCENATTRARARQVREAVTSRRVLLAATGITLMLFTFQGLTAFLTTYLIETKNLTEGTAGLLFGLLFVSGAVNQSAVGAFADRFGYSRVLVVIVLVGTVPLVAFPFLSGTLALGLAVVVMGIRLSMAPLTNAYVIDSLPAAVQGTAWGTIRTGFFMIGAFGSTVVGAMADADLFAEAFFLLAGLSVLAAAVFAVLPARERRGTSQESVDDHGRGSGLD